MCIGGAPGSEAAGSARGGFTHKAPGSHRFSGTNPPERDLSLVDPYTLLPPPWPPETLPENVAHKSEDQCVRGIPFEGVGAVG